MDLRKMTNPPRDAAIAAGERLKLMQKTASITTRRGKDFSTNADITSEQWIMEILQRATDPTIAMYGEETKGDIPKTGYVFIIDPLDGTHNYRRGCGPFGVSIALLKNGMPVMGTLYFPQTKTLYEGNDFGISEFMEHERPTVNGEPNLEQSTVWTDWTKQSAQTTLSILERLRECSVYPTMPLCSTHGLMMVATGKIEGFVHPYIAIEDHAAAGFLVQLAGGTVTDIHGKPWTPFSESIVATNGKIHEELIDAISDVV